MKYPLLYYKYDKEIYAVYKGNYYYKNKFAKSMSVMFDNNECLKNVINTAKKNKKALHISMNTDI